MAEGDLELRLIEPGDTLTGLSVGDAEFVPLKTFIQKDALRFQASNLARTYGLFDEADRLKGYVTLVCGEVAAEGTGDLAEGLRFGYRHFPAVKIARLMVDARVRGKGWGAQLVEFAVGTAKDIVCEAVGCRLIVVDAKRGSVDFYTRRGFTILDTRSNLDSDAPIMFLDIHKS